MKAETWTLPRPSRTGTNAPSVCFTPGSLIASDGRSPRSRMITAGSWTRNCAAEPTTAPHDTQIATESSLRLPASTAATISAAFHSTGET